MLLIFAKCLTHSNLQGPFLILFRMKVLSISLPCGIQKAVLNLLTSSLLPSPPSPILIEQLVTLCFDNSAGKESLCNSGDPSLISGLGRSTGEGIGYPLQYSFSYDSTGKESTCNARDPGSIPGFGRSPGEGEKGTHPSILAWRIPWAVQTMGSQNQT